jgi:hypothetical protein
MGYSDQGREMREMREMREIREMREMREMREQQNGCTCSKALGSCLFCAPGVFLCVGDKNSYLTHSKLPSRQCAFYDFRVNEFGAHADILCQLLNTHEGIRMIL